MKKKELYEGSTSSGPRAWATDFGFGGPPTSPFYTVAVAKNPSKDPRGLHHPGLKVSVSLLE